MVGGESVIVNRYSVMVDGDSVMINGDSVMVDGDSVMVGEDSVMVCALLKQRCFTTPVRWLTAVFVGSHKGVLLHPIRVLPNSLTWVFR